MNKVKFNNDHIKKLNLKISKNCINFDELLSKKYIDISSFEFLNDGISIEFSGKVSSKFISEFGKFLEKFVIN